MKVTIDSLQADDRTVLLARSAATGKDLYRIQEEYFLTNIGKRSIEKIDRHDVFGLLQGIRSGYSLCDHWELVEIDLERLPSLSDDELASGYVTAEKPEKLRAIEQEAMIRLVRRWLEYHRERGSGDGGERGRYPVNDLDDDIPF
jgi:hypothetical protein